MASAVVAVALTATAFSAQAQTASTQTTNICDRTQQVVDEILFQTSTDDDECEVVLDSEIAAIKGLSLTNKRITSLRLGDFDGLTSMKQLVLSGNDLAELPTGILHGLSNLFLLYLDDNAFESLPPDMFSGLSRLGGLQLQRNQLDELPDGIFSGLTNLHELNLHANSGTPFRFTVEFEPKRLDGAFDEAPIWLVLRVGAPRTITVPLLVTGATLSVNSLTLTTGSTQSAAVTVTRGSEDERFKLSQGELELGAIDSAHTGYEIFRGPPLTSGTRLRVKVFLEGALE